MHVVFVEPWFPRNQREFVRGLAAVGARVTAIGETPLEELDYELRDWLVRYERIGSVTDELRRILDALGELIQIRAT